MLSQPRSVVPFLKKGSHTSGNLTSHPGLLDSCPLTRSTQQIFPERLLGAGHCARQFSPLHLWNCLVTSCMKSQAPHVSGCPHCNHCRSAGSVLACQASPKHSVCAELRPRGWGPRAGSECTAPTMDTVQVPGVGSVGAAGALCCEQPTAGGGPCCMGAIVVMGGFCNLTFQCSCASSGLCGLVFS